MVILMLNMLIALISESHGDVMKLEKQAEVYEKHQLIIELKKTELNFFSGKKKDVLRSVYSNFLCVIQNEDSEASSEDMLERRIKNIESLLEDLKKTKK